MNEEFSVDLGNGYYQNPRTGEILEADSGMVFDQNYTPSVDMMSGEDAGSSSGAAGMGEAAGAGGSLLSTYMLYNMINGGSSAATPAAATAATSAAAPAASAAAPAAVSAGATTGAGATAGGATAFSSAAAAEAAGYTAVGSTADGGVLAIPAASGTIPTAALWAAPIAATAWGAKSAYDTYGDADKEGAWKGFKKNNNSLTDLGKILATGGLSLYGDAAAALAGSFFGSSKDKDQLSRDDYRKGMREAGFFGDPENPVDGWKKTLSSGAELDFGKDGGARLQNLGSNIDGRADRGYYDVDFSRGDSGDLAALLDPLGTIYGKGSDKGGRDMTGYLVNLAQQKGDAWSNAEELYGDLDYNTARDLISRADIEQARKDAMYNTLDDVYGVNAYAGKGTAWERKGLSNRGPSAYEKPSGSSSEPEKATTPAVSAVTPKPISGSAIPGRPEPAELDQTKPKPLPARGQSLFVRRPDEKKTGTQSQMNRFYRNMK